MSVEQEARPKTTSRARTLTVSEVVQETKDSITISFEVPDEGNSSLSRSRPTRPVMSHDAIR